MRSLTLDSRKTYGGAERVKHGRLLFFPKSLPHTLGRREGVGWILFLNQRSGENTSSFRVCVNVWMHMCIDVCTCVVASDWHQLSSSVACHFHLIFWDSKFVACYLARLAGWQASGVLRSSTVQCWDYRYASHLALYVGCRVWTQDAMWQGLYLLSHCSSTLLNKSSLLVLCRTIDYSRVYLAEECFLSHLHIR